MPAVNPDILIWARETAGMSLDVAAGKIQLGDTKKETGADRLAAIERGESEPSRSLLRRMAEKYRRPLITFYLSEPPRPGSRGEDFRRAPDAPPLDYDPQIDALLRVVRVRHDVVKMLLVDEEAEPINFVGSSTLNDSMKTVAKKICEASKFDLSQFRSKRSTNDAFTYLRKCLESTGIFVMLLGDLGSHHSKIGARSFRGYAIADPIAPFIVINDNDAKSAWSFTALHECAHIWLGQTGISGTFHETKTERFCNDVASHVLLPRSDIQAHTEIAILGFEEQVKAIAATAERFNVSQTMIAYQMLRNDMMDDARYARLAKHFYESWRKTKQSQDNTNDNRPNNHVIRRHRLGPAIVSLAQRSVQSGVLSPTKASQLLGVKTGSLHKFFNPKPAQS